MSTNESQSNGQDDKSQSSEAKSTKATSKSSSKASSSALAVKEGADIEQSTEPRYFLGIRPIAPSNLRVLDTTVPGHRPIFASDLEVVDLDMLPGHRPVFASNPALLHGSALPGNRPIAPNEIDEDDPVTLMGYLD